MRSSPLILCLLLAAGSGGSASEPVAAESARQTIAEWVQTQRILSEERAAWRQDEALLRQSIGLLEAEAGMLRTRLEELDAAGDEAAQQRRALGEENDGFRAASAQGGEFVTDLERELRLLLPALPGPLLAQTAPLLARLDEAGSRPAALSQRLQTVLGILGEVNRFQRTLTFVRETREFDDGSRREVRTIYLGLAQAFFVDDNGRIAGTGRPTSEGWVWTRNDRIAADVVRAIAVLQHQRPAEFIDLPVEVTE